MSNTSSEDDALIGMFAAMVTEDDSTDEKVNAAAAKLAAAKGLPPQTFEEQVAPPVREAAPEPSPTPAAPRAAQSAPTTPSPFDAALAAVAQEKAESEESRPELFADPGLGPDTSTAVEDAEVTPSAPTPLWMRSPTELDYDTDDEPAREGDEFTIDPPDPRVPTVSRAAAPIEPIYSEAFDDIPDDDEDDKPSPREGGAGVLGGVKNALGDAGGTLGGAWAKVKFGERPLPVRVLIIAVPIVLIVGIVASMMPKGGPPPTPQAPQTQAAVTTSSAPTNEERVLEPARVEGECAPPRTDASLAFSKEDNNAWVCLRAFGADGATLNIFFNRPVVITRIAFVPGWNYQDNWKKTRLVSNVVWNFGKGNRPLTQQPTAVPTESVLQVPSYAVTEMSAQIIATVPSDPNPADKTKSRSANADKSFAMSKLRIYGYVAGADGNGGTN